MVGCHGGLSWWFVVVVCRGSLFGSVLGSVLGPSYKWYYSSFLYACKKTTFSPKAYSKLRFCLLIGMLSRLYFSQKHIFLCLYSRLSALPDRCSSIRIHISSHIFFSYMTLAIISLTWSTYKHALTFLLYVFGHFYVSKAYI